MAPQHRSSSDAALEKATQTDAVVGDAMRRHVAAAPAEIAFLERSHPELMPELGARLRALRAIEQAQRGAARLPSAAPPDAWLEEDLEFLRRALDKYEVLERVKFGGQGVVYKARQKAANRLVAIKVLLDGPLASERQRLRFEREIELISRLRHPNIVTLLDTGTIRGRPYFAMEFVEGMPIDDCAALEDLTPREIVRLFIQVCRAVSYAHQNGVIHRDLSPANIYVDEQGAPRVFDFGLAKDVWAAEDGPAHTITGQVLGTLQFLSPEQAGGLDGKVDVRSDIYTLGVVLYALLTDGFPYPVDGTPQEIRNAIINTEPEPLRKAATAGHPDRMRGLDQIDRDLEIILAKALAKEKDARYQSAAALADDLERCLAGDAIMARADSHLYMLRKTIRRYRAAVAVAGIVLLTLAVSSVAVTTMWMQVRTQRDTARQAVTQAFDLFDTMMTDSDTLVRPLAGGVGVRGEMIEHLADQLPGFETLVGSDEALNPIVTRLAEKQGDLAFEQGARADARRHYEAFLAGSRRLVESDSPDPRHLDGLARAYRKYAAVADDPAEFYERGIQFAEGVLNQDPQRDDARHNLCQAHLGFAEYLYGLDRFDGARPHFARVIELCPPASAEQAAEARWLRAAAVATSRRGSILLKLGDGNAGIEELKRSLQIRERIAEAWPADTASRHGLMLSYIHVARAQRDAGNVEQAKALLHKAVAAGELLRTMDPTVTLWGIGLYSAYETLARLQLASDEVSDAQALCDAAFALADELASADGAGLNEWSTLAYAHTLRAQLLLSQEAPRTAYAEFEKAASIRLSLLEAEPDNARRREDLAIVSGWLARSSRAMGELEEAAEHYRATYQIRKELYESQSHVIERALDYIKSATNYAVACMDCRTKAQDTAAAKLLEDGGRLLNALRAKGKLVGLEGKYETWISAIQANQEILRQRSETPDVSGR